MTSTSGFQGGDVSKPSSRVLKPPGGGSSNIFGVDKSNQEKQKKQSDNSHSNIFGDSDLPKYQQDKKILDDTGYENGTQPASNLKEDGRTPFEAAVDNRRRMRETPNPIVGGDGTDCGSNKNKPRGGFNPITGEDYTGDGQDNNKNLGRRRQPPGGQSSGLW